MRGTRSPLIAEVFRFKSRCRELKQMCSGIRKRTKGKTARNVRFEDWRMDGWMDGW